MKMQSLLSRAFSLLALSGLMLTGWALILTPDNMQGNPAHIAWGKVVVKA